MMPNPMMGMGNMMQMMQQLKSNPMAFLRKRFNLPQNIGNDPQSIVNHLVNTGQISQDAVNQAYQMMQKFR